MSAHISFAVVVGPCVFNFTHDVSLFGVEIVVFNSSMNSFEFSHKRLKSNGRPSSSRFMFQSLSHHYRPQDCPGTVGHDPACADRSIAL